MSNTTKLKSWRDHAMREAREIQRKAERENRMMTPAEKSEWDRLMNEYDQLKREVEAGGASTRVTSPNDGGGGTGQFVDDPSETRALRDGETVREYLAARGRLDGAEQFRGLSFGRYVRSMVLGPENEAERRALAEGTDSSGGFTVPDILSAQMIDLLRAKTRVIRAGARMVPLLSDSHAFAKLATDPVPGWRAENATVDETDPTFTRVLFEPKTLAFIVRASRELLEDSVNLNEALPGVFAAAMAGEVDRVALVGSGSGSEPQGIAGTSGVNEVAVGGAITDYSELLDVRQLILEDNAEEPTAAIMAPRTGRTIAGFADSTGQPLRRPPALENMMFHETTQVPTDEGVGTDESSVFVGGFGSVWIGVRTSLRVEVLRERYADNLQYGFLVWARHDVQLEQAGALGVISGITTA